MNTLQTRALVKQRVKDWMNKHKNGFETGELTNFVCELIGEAFSEQQNEKYDLEPLGWADHMLED